MIRAWTARAAEAQVEKKRLRVIGRRAIVVGVVLVPFDVAAISAFVFFARDPIGTFSLTMTLIALSVVLIGFGIAALQSGKE